MGSKLFTPTPATRATSWTGPGSHAHFAEDVRERVPGHHGGRLFHACDVDGHIVQVVAGGQAPEGVVGGDEHLAGTVC